MTAHFGTSPDSAALLADQVRRFNAYWFCDREFRSDLKIDAFAAAAKRGLSLNAEDLRIVWDSPDDAAELPETLARTLSPSLLIWLELQARDRDYATRVRLESAPENPRFAGWRERQISRCELTFPRSFAKTTPHVPFAIELTKGCSVGCWFCGVDAPKLDGNFLHSAEDAELFRGVLKALDDIVGQRSGQWGCLYWATDPFDNPDYERFAFDFADQFGRFPATTTAKAWVDIPRLRRLIPLCDRHGRSRLRLSVLTRRILNRYLSELSPHEFARVSLVPVNRGSPVPIAAAGRARLSGTAKWEAERFGEGSSIACVSGFLLNMVERTVRLISPCESSDRWPSGFFVFEEARFENADEFRSAAEGMIERHMPAHVPGEIPLRFNSDLTYAATSDGFELSHIGTRRFEGGRAVGQIGRLIHGETPTFCDLVAGLGPDAAAEVSSAVQDLFEAGVVNAEPT